MSIGFLHRGSERLSTARKRTGQGRPACGTSTEFKHLQDRVGALAIRRRFTADEPRVLWNTGDDGRRLIALVIIKARPDLGTVSIVVVGISEPRSPLEQMLALEAADGMLDELSGEDRSRLRVAIQGVLSDDPTSRQAERRWQLAMQLLGRMTSDTQAE